MKRSRLERDQRYLDLDARYGRRLAEIRDSQGLSQQQVADEMSYKRPFVSKIEHGHRHLNACEISDYARALDVDPLFLCRVLLDVVVEYDSSALGRQQEGDAPKDVALK